MKNYLTILAGVALLGISSCACAATITIGGVDTDVGYVDSFLATDVLVSGSGGNVGDDTVLTWVTDTLNTLDPNYDVTTEWTVKTEDVTYYSTDETGVYAVELTTAPTHFLLKNSTEVALFQNDIDYDWGVFDIATIVNDAGLVDMNIGGDEFTISFVSEFNDTTDRGITPPAVPIPAAAWLFMSGLVGLVAVGRRKA